MDIKLIKKFNQTQNEIAKTEAQVMEATVALQKKLATLREQDTQVREAIKEAMVKTGTKKFESDTLMITYVAPSKRKSLDSAKLKAEAPGIYDKYVKESDVAASVRIKVKDNA